MDEETATETDSYVLEEIQKIHETSETLQIPTLEQQIGRIHSKETSEPAEDAPSTIPDDVPALLETEHPLLERFQKTLKEHLLRVHAQLSSEIAILDQTIGENDAEREELGTKLYDLQREIDVQRSQLHAFSTKILETSTQRQKKEDSITLLKRDFGQKSVNYKDAKRLYNEMVRELQNMQILENEISKWTKEVKDEISVAKRVVSKDAKDKMAAADEKRKMDLFLFNLDFEVRRREAELTNINEQICEQNALIEELSQSLADANSDLEALQGEHKRLFQAWGEVIVAIQQRDKALSKTKDELNAELEEQKVIKSNTENTRKAIHKELEQNEQLTRFKNRIVADLHSLERQVLKQEDENESILKQIEQFGILLERTEEDFRQARTEGLIVENHLKKLRNRLERQAKERFNLEEQILELLQDQITSDKSSGYRAKLLRDTQEKRRRLEIMMAKTELGVANMLVEIERWKGIIFRAKQNEERLQKDHQDTILAAKIVSDEVEAIKTQISGRMNTLDLLNRQLQQLIAEAGGKEINPLEMKVITLKKDIQALEKETKEVQRFWLILQTNAVRLSNQRNAQVNELYLSRKQLPLVEQKCLKLEADMAALQAEAKETDRALRAMTLKFDNLNATLYEKKQFHEKFEDQCELQHKEINDRLQDQELEILQLEESIEDLQCEIEDIKLIVMERHHETLSWETKYKMAVETKRYRDREMANTSEIAVMKAEIHRMEVRHAQLRRAQEKLVQDLDNCVNHRDHIFDSANARDKIAGLNRSKSKLVLQHKINEMRNKIKQINAEISATENSLTDIIGQQRVLEGEVEGKKQEISDEKYQDKLLQEEMEQGMLIKQENLETIVRKQHRAKCYRRLLTTSQPYKRRGEAQVNQDFDNQCQAHEHLINIVEGLQQDFPDQKFAIARILQTLKH